MNDGDDDDDSKSIIDMDFSSLYPTIMRDFQSEFIRMEAIRINRDEIVDDILNDNSVI